MPWICDDPLVAGFSAAVCTELGRGAEVADEPGPLFGLLSLGVLPAPWRERYTA